MVGAVGETASMKRSKLWKTGEDGLCCSSSAIQTRLDPSSLLEERSETPIVFVVIYIKSKYFLVVSVKLVLSLRLSSTKTEGVC